MKKIADHLSIRKAFTGKTCMKRKPDQASLKKINRNRDFVYTDQEQY